MAENTDLTSASIKSAASESVLQDAEIRARVRDLTLQALKSRHLDPVEIKEVVRAMSEGISLGAESRASDMRKTLAEALAGLDEALMKSAEASHLALKELTSKGKEFSDNELKQALNNLKKLEEDFLNTVGQVADAGGGMVKQELRELLSHARRAGTDTGRQVAATMNEFAHRMTTSTVDSTISGLDAARVLSARFAMVASGILAGLAEALRDRSSGKKAD